MATGDDDDLYQTIGAYVVPQLLYIAARLGLADHLEAGPLAAATLAEQTGAHPPTLERALRALTSIGVFARTRDGRFRLTPAALPLLTEHPHSRRASILFAGDEQHRAWGAVMHSMTTGLPAFDHVFGESLGQHLAHDEAAMTAAEALRARRSARRNLAIADALDPGRARTIVDVGGGSGELLAVLLARHPMLSGVLVEAPHVAARARIRLAALGLADRCEVVAADARAELPPNHDIYLLVEVLHCYDDPEAAKILRRCHGPRIIIGERVLAPAARASADHLADLHMLVMYGGRERTRRDHANLLAAADLRLRRVIRTESWVSLVDAAPRSTPVHNRQRANRPAGP